MQAKIACKRATDKFSVAGSVLSPLFERNVLVTPPDTIGVLDLLLYYGETGCL